MIFTKDDAPIIGHTDHIYGLFRNELIELLPFLIYMQNDFIHASLDNPKQNKGIIVGRRNTKDLMKRIRTIYPSLLLEYHLVK